MPEGDLGQIAAGRNPDDQLRSRAVCGVKQLERRAQPVGVDTNDGIPRALEGGTQAEDPLRYRGRRDIRAAAFVYANYGDARIESSTLRGEFERNNLFFLNLIFNWKKTPWSG